MSREIKLRHYQLFICIDISNSIIYDAPALEKAGSKERLSLRKQGNLSDIFEVSNGKCRKEKKEENK
jgi:hypothetical protein